MKKALDYVSLPLSSLDKYPHEFSGGERQRIVIARALSIKPKFIVCDEPTSALDVSIQAEIINLLKELQKEFDLTYLFISHDLAVVKHICDDIALMYLGEIMEKKSTKELFSNPEHPYTKALLSAIPIPDPILERNRKPLLLKGETPSVFANTKGCSFAHRCPYAITECHERKPVLSNADSFARCNK